MMKNSKYTRDKELVTTLLKSVGITVNGYNPWDMQIHDDRVYPMVLREAALGLGESYMNGWWDCEELDKFISLLLQGNLKKYAKRNRVFLAKLLISKIFNFQSPARSFEVGEIHYDIDVDFYSSMLDSKLNYSCGYWKNVDTLEEAQLAKLELTCQKLYLQPGMKVLDIGCGWGAFAKYAARNYGVDVVGVTVSQSQAEWAQQNCSGLPVDIRFQDYREIDENFDRVVSIGMFEHVGCKNYKTYFNLVNKCLSEDGLFLLHTIGMNGPEHGVDEWVVKYIFPNAMLPAAAEILTASSGLLTLEDWHTFGSDYYKTLQAWQNNLNNNWQKLSYKYDDRFKRMFDYFLMYFAGGFRAEYTQLWQLVFSKRPRLIDYVSIR